MTDGLGRTLKLVVAYDGRRFVGSQRQPGGRTVQAELEQVCETLFRRRSPCRLAGRTDSGVHAVGQVAAVLDPGDGRSVGQVRAAMNGLLPDDVAVSEVQVADESFDPRRDARWREYRYRIVVGGRNPLLRGVVHERREPLDLEAMAVAADVFVGEHDLAGFAGMGAGTPWSSWRDRPRATTRRIFRCECRPVEDRLFGAGGDVIEVVVVGDAFLPRQVRGMVGALIEVGRGRRDAAWIEELLVGADRRDGPENAPPDGLVLWAVGYAPFTEGERSTHAESKKETDGSSHVHTEDRRHQA